MWFIEPTKIDLREYVQKPKFEKAALDLTYTKHLVAIDGIQPEIAENVRELGFEGDNMTDDTDMQSNDLEGNTAAEK